MRQKRMAFTTCHGFTLVELLVVIMIISVLAAMLMPTLIQSMDAARAIQCKNNSRQLGMIFAEYLNNSDNTFPYLRPSYAPSPAYWSPSSCVVSDCLSYHTQYSAGYTLSATNLVFAPWYRRIAPYLGVDLVTNYNLQPPIEILRCPSNPWPYYHWSTYPSINYGLNAMLIPGTWGVSGNAAHIKTLKESRLIKPSATLFSGEIPNGGNTEFGKNFEYLWTQSTPFRLPSYASWWSSDTIGSYAMVVHDGAWNSLLCDGHVETSPLAQLVLYANQSADIAPNTPGRMFWANTR